MQAPNELLRVTHRQSVSRRRPAIGLLASQHVGLPPEVQNTLLPTNSRELGDQQTKSAGQSGRLQSQLERVFQPKSDDFLALEPVEKCRTQMDVHSEYLRDLRDQLPLAPSDWKWGDPATGPPMRRPIEADPTESRSQVHCAAPIKGQTYSEAKQERENRHPPPGVSGRR